MLEKFDTYHINVPKFLIINVNIIDSLQEEFNYLVENKEKYNKLVIDYSSVKFVRGELTPFLGINIRRIQRNKIKVYFKNPGGDKQVNDFLYKNGFYEKMLGESKNTDIYGTVIDYKEINSRNILTIHDYIRGGILKHIKNKAEKLSSSFENRFEESIFELSDNVKTHSDSNLVTMCGQFYPKKSSLAFSICDSGLTIPIVIKKNFNKKFDSFKDSEIVDWATKLGNTTKPYSKSGGIGLYTIIDEIMKNRGEITIISNYGYWFKDNNKVNMYNLNNLFPGTMVIFKLDTQYNEINNSIDNDISF